MNTNGQFKNQAFLNLETFYKDGKGVKTPVWFVQDKENFYVRTIADSWKVRRIHRNPDVKIVPCKVQGEPIGEWVPAVAREIQDPERQQAINKRFNHKYGLQKRMFDILGKIRRDPMTTLEIKLADQ